VLVFIRLFRCVFHVAPCRLLHVHSSSFLAALLVGPKTYSLRHLCCSCLIIFIIASGVVTIIIKITLEEAFLQAKLSQKS
jgi:hypothetical protein